MRRETYVQLNLSRFPGWTSVGFEGFDSVDFGGLHSGENGREVPTSTVWNNGRLLNMDANKH
jgi:hypothetical protein